LVPFLLPHGVYRRKWGDRGEGGGGEGGKREGENNEGEKGSVRKPRRVCTW